MCDRMHSEFPVGRQKTPLTPERVRSGGRSVSILQVSILGRLSCFEDNLLRPADYFGLERKKKDLTNRFSSRLFKKKCKCVYVFVIREISFWPRLSWTSEGRRISFRSLCVCVSLSPFLLLLHHSRPSIIESKWLYSMRRKKLDRCLSIFESEWPHWVLILALLIFKRRVIVFFNSNQIRTRTITFSPYFVSSSSSSSSK